MAVDRGTRLIRDDNSEVGVVAIVGLGTGGAVTAGSPPLPAGTNRSGTVGTTAQTLAPANANRQTLTGQNVSTGNIGINEIGGTAAIGSPGTYTIAAGQAFSVSTNQAVSIIGSAAGLAYTATET